MSLLIIITYLLMLLALFITLSFLIVYDVICLETLTVEWAVWAALFGLLGGIIHCLRSVYLHYSVHRDWNAERWAVWYFLRPVVSTIMGLVSYVFIKAGLLLLTTDYSDTTTTRIFYLAVAFLAGYNVKNFLERIERISKSILGIEPKEG